MGRILLEPAVPPILLLATHFWAGLVPSYPNSEQDRAVARTPTNILRVEGGARLAHKGRLQDVPTLTILQELALI